jgi:hypothetical protein
MVEISKCFQFFLKTFLRANSKKIESTLKVSNKQQATSNKQQATSNKQQDARNQRTNRMLTPQPHLPRQFRPERPCVQR